MKVLAQIVAVGFALAGLLAMTGCVSSGGGGPRVTGTSLSVGVGYSSSRPAYRPYHGGYHRGLRY